MEWTSVENELPPPGEKVVTYTFEEGDRYHYIEQLAFGFQDGKGNWINEYTGQIEENQISYWIPLPEPPKE